MEKYIYFYKLRKPRNSKFQGVQIGTLEARGIGEAEDMLDMMMGKYGYGGELIRFTAGARGVFITSEGQTVYSGS